MTILLHLDSSLHSDAVSFSRRLSAAVVRQLSKVNPGCEILRRDLDAEATPHVTSALRSGWTATPQQRTLDQVEIVTRGEGYIAELKAADTIVIGVPMYNFSVPSTLKAWIDHVLIAGQTFRYTPTGPEGLLSGKRAILASARGGTYATGPLAALDHQEAYLKVVLGFIGITDVAVVRAEGLGRGPEAAAQSLQTALASIADMR